jgi:hypothetical protein
MRSYLAAFAMLAPLAVFAGSPPLHNPPDLRRMLRQEPGTAMPPAPRQLSPEQRAELRRQLGDFRPAPRRAP